MCDVSYLDGCRRSMITIRLAALAIACVSSLIAAPQASAAQLEVRLNEVIRTLFYAPEYVALSLGAFEQEGLKVTSFKTTWGTQAALTEVVSGNSDIALIGPEAATLTRDASPERRLVNFAQLTDGDGSFIISKTPVDSFKITDLKGKTIVTTGVGSTPALVLDHLLRRAGLEPGKDVNVRYIPNSANIIPAYLDPNTNFAQAFEPMALQAIKDKKAYRAASVGQLLGPVPYTAFMASATYIDKNPAIIQAFTNGIYRGLIWTDTHSVDQIAELIAPYFKEFPSETARAVISEYKKVNIFATRPLISEAGMNQMMDLLVEGNVLKQRLPYSQVVNPTFAEKALETIKR